ncbi:MAG: hypothetical protein KGL35_25760, partial [Bradyrhizobium sp.]|nr:hypothetical protein [Bradyrhizobium sp.]
KVYDLEATYAERDRRHRNVWLVRNGQLASVFPDLFGTINDQPFVANYIDVVARDLAEMIAPMPALNCVSGTITSDAARRFAAKRQRIGMYYWIDSRVSMQITTAADQYLTYGYVPLMIEPDFDKHFPRFRFLDPRHGYPEFGPIGETVSFTSKHKTKASKLAALYPQFAQQLKSGVSNAIGQTRDQDLHVYRYVDKDQTLVFVKERNNLVLERVPNRLGMCPIQCAVRPSSDDQIRGQFDDVLAPLAAKALMARLSLEAAEKTIQAPIVLPDDAVDLPLGPDAIIRTANPAGVGRVRLDVSNAGILEQSQLDAELRLGTRYPEGRSGDVQGSIVTGRGVEALLGTFDTQVKTHQTVFGELLRRQTYAAFKLDETYWPGERKEIRGVTEGVPFAEKYTPSADIKGDYTCDVTYGMLAGMDPNRGLLFLLQARGAELIDRQTAMRNMPFDIDVTQLERNIDVEKMREAGLAGLLATAQSIGPIIEQGGDVGQILQGLAKAIKDRQDGKPVEDALLNMVPPPPPQQPGGPGAPGGPGGVGPDGQPLPPGEQPSGLLQGVAPGQAGQAPGGRPALQQLMAGLTSAGKPNLTANIRRQLPIQGG